MLLSSSEFFTIVFTCNILIIILWFYLKSVKRIRILGTGVVIACVIYIIFRLLIPMEFIFSYSIPVQYLLPKLFKFSNSSIITIRNINFTWINIINAIWILGIIVLTIRTIIKYLKFGNEIKQQILLEDKKVLNTLDKVILKYNKKISFQIIIVDFITTPMLYGIHAPKILIPVMELSEKDWNFILSHEVEHYYRRDLYIKLLIEIITIAYWWNPFIYLLKTAFDKVLEINVDLSVTKDLDPEEKLEYLQCLLDTARKFSPKKLYGLSLAFESRNKSILAQRFYMVLESENSKKSSKTILMIMPIIFISIFSLLVVFEPYAISPTDAQSTFELDADNAYLIVNPNRDYDLYINQKYIATVHEIKSSYSNLSIYQNLKEANAHEIK